jgi:hypothetical protein
MEMRNPAVSIACPKRDAARNEVERCRSLFFIDRNNEKCLLARTRAPVFFCYLQESRTVRRTSVAQSTLDFLHPGSTLSPPRYIFPDENCCDDVGQMMFEP